MSRSPRTLVFISYSHRDAEWLEPIRTLLKPFTRQGVLEVFADPYIRVGEQWERRIDEALARTAVGVVLVSGDFFASDFITDRELAPLVADARAGLLTLVCVPLRPSAYQSPDLAQFQWAHPPDRPLSLLPPGERDRALAAIVTSIVEAARAGVGRDGDAVPPVPPEPTRAAEPVTPPAGDGQPGPLHGVPELPPHYVVRSDAVDRLRDQLFRSGNQTVGITGASSRVGLHGQGGIGKTVLAQALARDPAVRRAFPGGVFWIALGQDPDLPRLQARLGRQITGENVAITDVEDGRELLQERLAQRHCLLVLDDVWDVRHARAFDVLGGGSRMLVTTRDGAILTALGAREEIVPTLREEAAVRLLASWAGEDIQLHARTVRAVARACGYLPLALSVAGARARDGVPWADVLEGLRRGRMKFLDHPYASVFRSLAASVDALPPGARDRYVELAVFPEDERIPEGAVLAMWERTAGQEPYTSRALLARLQRMALLKWAPRRRPRQRRRSLRRIRRGDERLRERLREVTLHDLQQDFLRVVAQELPSLHSTLVDALSGGRPLHQALGDWRFLRSNELYPWTRLAYHLISAGRGEDLRSLLLDSRWLGAKLRATGLAALLADYGWFAGDTDMDLLARTLRISATVLADDPSHLPSQFLARLLDVDRPAIRALLHSLRTTVGTRPWLEPVSASLSAPGSGLLRTINAHATDVTAVAFDPHGEWIASASKEGVVRLFEVETGRERLAFRRNGSSVRAMAVCPDGSFVLSGGDSGEVQVWRPDTGTILGSLQLNDAIGAVTVRHDGGLAVAGTSGGELVAWSPRTGARAWTASLPPGWVRGLAFSPDGYWVLAGSWRGTAILLDAVTGVEVRTLGRHASAVAAVAFTPGGRQAVTASFDGTLKVWEPTTGHEVFVLRGHVGRVNAVAVTARRAVSGSRDGRLRVWNLDDGSEITAVHGHTAAIGAVAVTLDGAHAVSGGHDGTLKLWDLNAIVEGASDRRIGRSIQALALSPDGRHVLSGSEDGVVTLWSAATGRLLDSVGGHAGPVEAIAFSEDGFSAVSRSADRTVNWRFMRRLVRLRVGVQLGRLVALYAGQRKRRGSLTRAGQLAPFVSLRRSRRRPPLANDLSASFKEGIPYESFAASDNRSHAVAKLPGNYYVLGTDDGFVRILAPSRNQVDVFAPNAYWSGSNDEGFVRDFTRTKREVAAFAADAGVLCCVAARDGKLIVTGDAAGRVHFLRVRNLAYSRIRLRHSLGIPRRIFRSKRGR